MPIFWPKKTWIAYGAISLILVVTIPLLLIWRWKTGMERVLQKESKQLEQEASLPFTASSSWPRGDLSPIYFQSSSEIRSVLYYQDRWWIGTDSGFQIYSPEGKLEIQNTVDQGWPQKEAISLALFNQAPVAAVSGIGLFFPENGPLHISPQEAACRLPTSLLSTVQGDLWVGTNSCGLARWKNNHLERVRGGPGTQAHITCLAGDSLDLWVGTFEQGLWRFHGGYWKNWNSSNGLPENCITSVAASELNLKLAIGTPLGGVWMQDDSIQGRYLENESITSSCYWDGRFLISTHGGAIFEMVFRGKPRPVYSPYSTQQETTAETGHSHPLQFLFEKDALYVHTQKALWRIHDTSASGWTRVLELQNSGGSTLSNPHVNSLALDESGRLWIGYFDAGLDILDVERQTLLRHWQDDLLFCINAISFDATTRAIYVATANGLALFSDPEHYRAIRREEGLIHNSVSMAIPIQPGSRSILAATAGGLTILEPLRARSIFAFHGLPSNQLYALAPTAQGVYIGSLAGLSFYDFKNPPRNYSRANSPLTHNWINALLYQDHYLWIGTYGGGVQLLSDEEKWDRPTSAGSHSYINPNALAYYRQKVFAGALEEGLFIFSIAQKRYAVLKSYLPSLNVTAIAANDRYLYVGTDHGLIAFSPSDIQNYFQDTSRPFDGGP